MNIPEEFNDHVYIMIKDHIEDLVSSRGFRTVRGVDILLIMRANRQLALTIYVGEAGNVTMYMPSMDDVCTVPLSDPDMLQKIYDIISAELPKAEECRII